MSDNANINTVQENASAYQMEAASFNNRAGFIMCNHSTPCIHTNQNINKKRKYNEITSSIVNCVILTNNNNEENDNDDNMNDYKNNSLNVAINRCKIFHTKNTKQLLFIA
jgi:hypothetical protein